jgi:hypothetical protein
VTKVLLSLHVLAAIVAIGPVTVAASMFPAALRRGDVAAMRVLNRICRVYALLGVAVPVFGLATAQSLGVLGDAWLLVSIALTVVAAAVLGFAVLPAQAAALVSAAVPSTLASVPDSSARAAVADSSALASAPDSSDVAGSPASQASRLGMTAGVFNLLWAVVVVLMIVRPGSTTGA